MQSSFSILSSSYVLGIQVDLKPSQQLDREEVQPELVPTTVNDEHWVEILGKAVRKDNSKQNGAGIPDYM
jgi:hypothetical protein